MMWWIGSKALVDAANSAANAALPDDKNAATGQVVPDVTLRWDVPWETDAGLWTILKPIGMALPAGLTEVGVQPIPKVIP